VIDFHVRKERRSSPASVDIGDEGASYWLDTSDVTCEDMPVSGHFTNDREVLPIWSASHKLVVLKALLFSVKARCMLEAISEDLRNHKTGRLVGSFGFRARQRV